MISQKELRLKRRQLAEDSRQYGHVMQSIDVTPAVVAGQAAGITNPPKAAWRSRGFLAQLFRDRISGHMRLSIQKTTLQNNGNWDEGITWEQLMTIKDQCGYGRIWAVEVFPSNADVVNVASMRHLWLLDTVPSYGWSRDR